MRVAFKFFVVAYSLVLLATGIGGMVLVQQVNETLWSTRVEQVKRAESYALDTFCAYAELLPGTMTDAQKRHIGAQIRTSLDTAVDELEIEQSPSGELSERYADGEGAVTFEDKDGRLRMKIECCAVVHNAQYVLRLYADFSDLRTQGWTLWQSYSVTVLALSLVSGLLIFFVSKTVTRPLKVLSRSAQQIADGEYEARAAVKSRDKEIRELSASFNHMAATVSETIRAVTEEAERRERFTADFAHEMKTPMTAILGYAQLLERYDLSEEERRAAAKTIHREGARLEKLSLQMLLWSTPQDETALVPVSLETVTLSLKETLTVLSERYQTPFELALGTETVMAEEVSLLSLLYNLADNAFKASQGNTVRIDSTDGGDHITVSVRDRGCGIAAEHMDKLTEPFFRADRSRSRAHGGTGLGLSICRRIAERHGTALRFDSAEGVGTVVSFDLRKGGEADA